MSSVASEEDFACIPGLGENKQKPRVLGSFFDVVDDAFSGRSPSLPSETDSVMDSRSVSVIEGSSSSSNMSESDSRSTSAASDSPPESDVLADEEGNSQEVYDDKSENEMDNENDGLEENIFEARSLLLKNVIITHADGGAVPADVLVKDGKIAKIDSSIDVSGDVTKIKDAGGLWLTPGSVKLGGDKEDENSHLSRGTTVMIHHLSAEARSTDILEALSQKKSALAGRSPANYGFGYRLENVNELCRNDVEEVMTTDKGVTMITINPSQLSNLEVIQTFRRMAQLGGIITRVQLGSSDLASHLSRLGVSEVSLCEELEEAQVRRLSTLAKQTGLAICLAGVTHRPALEVIKEFRSKGVEIWAELSAKVTQSTVAWVMDDKSLRDIVIMTPSPEVTDLRAHVQLACANPLRMLGSDRGSVVTGSMADLVIWARNEGTEEEDCSKDNLTQYSVKYVLVNGSVALAAGEGVNPTRAGEFVELTRVKSDDGEGPAANQSPVSGSRDHCQPIRVERERSEDLSQRVKTAGISLDPAGVTSLDQVPRMFQRRVSAFGVRNQQDSTFSLASETPEEDEDPETRHTSLTGSRRASVASPDQSEASVRRLDQSEAGFQSLTGSRRASVRVRAPPGGLSSGFW